MELVNQKKMAPIKNIKENGSFKGKKLLLRLLLPD